MRQMQNYQNEAWNQIWPYDHSKNAWLDLNSNNVAENKIERKCRKTDYQHLYQFPISQMDASVNFNFLSSQVNFVSACYLALFTLLVWPVREISIEN